MMSSKQLGQASISDLISSVRISDVQAWLGGERVKAGRGRAFWRGGEGRNVVFDDRKNCWWDHAASEGGGVLDLIIRVREGDRKAAVQWLSQAAGIPLRNLSPEQKRVHARFAVRADRLAQDMDDYWTGLDAALEQRREHLKILARLALKIGDEKSYERLEQLVEPLRKAIARIASSAPDELGRLYVMAVKENPLQVQQLQTLARRKRDVAKELTQSVVEMLAPRPRDSAYEKRS
jgi:hypothetical protein